MSLFSPAERSAPDPTGLYLKDVGYRTKGFPLCILLSVFLPVMSSPDLLNLEPPSLVALSDEGSDRPEKPPVPDELIKSASAVVRILVVDDHELTRKTICDLLRNEPGFEVICEAENGLEGARAAEKLQPDVVILDITMPTLGGIEAAVRIRRTAPKARLVFLSQHNADKLAQAALATGAHGYVVKSAAGSDLVRAVRAALAGQKFVSKLTSWKDR
jgi:CheY-like chemotaxis protein